jgi:hypothetical protein
MEPVMHLTDPQKQAVARGEAVAVLVDSTACVVLRADVFQRVKAVLEEGLEPEQVGRLIDENMREVDAGDPLLDSYQRYR